jgi:hypothetical protein
MERAARDAARHRAIAKNDQRRTVVGTNNLATISFDASPSMAAPAWTYAHQQLWFRLEGPSDELRPYTVHSAILDVLPVSALKPTATDLGATLPDLSAWADLISFRPPMSVQQAVRARSSVVGNWYVHRLESAFGGDINLDYYPVRVTTLPWLGGGVISADQLLAIIRKTLTSRVSATLAQFAPYDPAVDGLLWTSNSPLNAVVHIDMFAGGVNVEDGSVVVSSNRPDRWIFSTIWTTDDFGHPVSGNRAFGYVLNEDGSWTFYTRGADRATTVGDLPMIVFPAAHQLWVSLQDGIVAYVKSTGGEAAKEQPHSARYSWRDAAAVYWRPAEEWLK